MCAIATIRVRGAEQPLELVEDQRAAIVDRRDAQPRAALLAEICHGTMFEWCSIAEISTSSPGAASGARRRARPG